MANGSHAAQEGSEDAPDPIAAFYRAYNQADAGAAAALYADDGWHEEAHDGARRQGRETLRQGLEGFFGFLRDAHWQVRERIDSGPRVVVIYTLTGRTRGETPITLPGVHVFELADGRIAGTRDYWDPASFRRQMRKEPA